MSIREHTTMNEQELEEQMMETLLLEKRDRAERKADRICSLIGQLMCGPTCQHAPDLAFNLAFSIERRVCKDLDLD